MTLLMFDKHPLVLDKNLAAIIGLNQALVLQQVHYWLELNKRDGRNLHEGYHWTYNTIEEWNEQFPFWSKETVKRAFGKLRQMGFILVDNFNVYRMDRTLWYRIDYDRLEEYIRANSSFERVEDDPMEEEDLSPAIPETTTKTSTDIYNQSVNQEEEEEEKDRPTEKKKNFEEEYQRILEACNIEAIDEVYRAAVAHALKLLVLDAMTSKYVRIGDKSYPGPMVLKDLEGINFMTIEHAIEKFREASANYQIQNTVAYLRSCIYNSIHEKSLEIDSNLRYNRII